jgi:adenosylmethionine-8-amino-7-oxononanoate aminotransferase
MVRPPAHMTVLSPPLILTEAEIQTIADTLHDSIQATCDDLAREGLL